MTVPPLRDAVVIWTRRPFVDEGTFVGASFECDDGWKYLPSGIYTTPVEQLADLATTSWW